MLRNRSARNGTPEGSPGGTSTLLVHMETRNLQSSKAPFPRARQSGRSARDPSRSSPSTLLSIVQLQNNGRQRAACAPHSQREREEEEGQFLRLASSRNASHPRPFRYAVPVAGLGRLTGRNRKRDRSNRNTPALRRRSFRDQWRGACQQTQR